MTADFYPFKIGKFECVSLCDGDGDFELEIMVCNAPRSDVETALRAHAMPTNLITTPYTFLYVRTPEHQVLVDMGAGKFAPRANHLLEHMRQAGLDPLTIDTVIITHAHPDHVGGALDDKGTPTFANARHFIWKGEWDFWFSESATSKAGERFTTIARQQLMPLKDKLTFFDQEGEVLPGISLLSAPGHTPGHMVVSFTSGGERLLYAADSALQPIHLEHPAWAPAYDILPEQAIASKRRIFDLAASSGCWLIGQHFPPFPSLGHIARSPDANGWRWMPKQR